MIDRYEGHGCARAQQLVIAIAVGGRFDGQSERLGYLQRCDAERVGHPMQQVHDVRAANHLLLERRGAGVAHGVKAVDRHHGEDFDELAVTIGVLGQALAKARHGGG